MNDGTPQIEQDDRMWAMAAHIGALVVSFFSGGLLCFVVPLVIYVAKKDASPFIGEHAKESLNFRLTLLIGYVVLTPVAIILAITGIGLCIVIPFAIAVWIVELVLSIVAGMKASGGEGYRYPFAIRLVS